MTDRSEESSLDRKLKILDVVFKGITAIVVVTGVVFGFIQFQDVRRQESVQREKELNTLLYKTQLDLYILATDATAKFSQARTREEAETASKDFWVLYYGKLSIVEDEGVKQAMVQYGKEIKEWKEATIPPNDFIAPAAFNSHIFPNLSYILSQRCREHLNAAFKQQLPPLSTAKP